MHILYILDFYKPNTWGIEVLFEQIINYFWKKHKITVLTWNFTWNLPEIEKNWNITIHRLKAKNLIHFTLLWYKKWLKLSRNCDIIHTSNFYSAIITKKIKQKLNKKTILHVNWFFWKFRFNMIDFLRAYKFTLLEKINVKWNFDKFIAVSRYMQDVLNFYYWIDRKKIELVYNGIDYKKWKNLVNQDIIKQIKTKYNLDGNFSLLFYGRIENVKWWDFVLESLKILNIPNLKVLFILYWNFKQLENKVKKLWGTNLKYKNWILFEFNLQFSTVYIIPWVKHYQIPNFIKSVNCIIFPSLTESFGYVWLETSILQTPIICSNSWAIEEIVFWKVNFFQSQNQESFKQAIMKSYNWQYEYISSKNFDIKLTLEKIEKIYNELQWQ